MEWWQWILVGVAFMMALGMLTDLSKLIEAIGQTNAALFRLSEQLERQHHEMAAEVSAIRSEMPEAPRRERYSDIG